MVGIVMYFVAGSKLELALCLPWRMIPEWRPPLFGEGYGPRQEMGIGARASKAGDAAAAEPRSLQHQSSGEG
jgi:hypothetical protein